MTAPERRAAIKGLIGRPYELGAGGPVAFDCYSATREVQRLVFGREMPSFEMPGQAGRMGIAAAISAHPERDRWVEVTDAVDGAIVTMARHLQGYHMGTWLEEDGGVIIHSLEDIGVTVDGLPALRAIGWRRFRFHVPASH